MNKICKQLYTNFPSSISLVCHSVNDEMQQIANLNEKSPRAQEHRLGRYCAEQALKAIGIKCDEIKSSAQGYPIWPKGIVGSISHSKGLCLSAVAKSSDFQAIGIDVEQLNRMKESSIERIVHSEEKVAIGNDLKKATLLFSIKEAFYKAQFPHYKIPLNFKDLAFEYDFSAQKAHLIWLSEKSPIPKIDYTDWRITYQVIENNCFALCSKEQ